MILLAMELLACSHPWEFNAPQRMISKWHLEERFGDYPFKGSNKDDHSSKLGGVGVVYSLPKTLEVRLKCANVSMWNFVQLSVE